MFSCPKNYRTTEDNKYILIGDPLGDGISASVYKCLDSNTGKEYAIKLFYKKNKNFHEIMMNKEISKMVNPSFVEFINYSFSYNYIVFELCEKGDLMKYVQNLTNDKLIKFVIYKILKIVQFLHQNGFAHRDLKPDNIFLDNDFSFKIGDFGQSLPFINKNEEKIFLKGECGTPKYKAPEIYEKEFYDGEKIDIFSIGVILFSIKLKVFPFQKASSNCYTYKQIMDRNKTNFWKSFQAFPNIPHLSKEFKDLFFKMVSYDPGERPTIQDILNDPWMIEVSRLDENGIKALEIELKEEFGGFE